MFQKRIKTAQQVVDLENPNTWRHYRKGMCRGCQAGCCTLVVEVTADDLIRLQFTDRWEIDNTLKSLIKRLKKDDIIQKYNPKTERFTLSQLSNGDCLFLDSQRRCRVYSRRPDVCRQHPVERSPRIGYCPCRTGKQAA